MVVTFKPTQEFDVAVARGVVMNTNNNPYLHVLKSGYNPAVGVSDEFIWPHPASGFQGVSAGSSKTLRVKAGGHASDAVAGAGARFVMVEGLDRDGYFRSEQLALQGASASSGTSEQFVRVNHFYVLEVGQYGLANIGAITLEATTGELYGYIPPGIGRDQQCVYSVPIDHTGLLRSVDVTVDARSGADFRIVYRRRLKNTSTNVAPVETLWEAGPLEQKQYRQVFTQPILIEGGSDVYVLSNSGTANGADLSATMEILLIPDK